MFRGIASRVILHVNVVLALLAVGSPAWAQHHGGIGHRGLGHRGGFGHRGFGHHGFGHRGLGHHGGFGHLGFRHHGLGHSRYYYPRSYPSRPHYGSYYGNSPYRSYYGYPYFGGAYGLRNYSRPYGYGVVTDGLRSSSSVTEQSEGKFLSRSSGTGSPRIQRVDKEQEYQHRAETAFRCQMYDQAARFTKHAILENPQNGKLFLFLSQSLLATGDYRGAADAAQRGTSLLAPDDWGSVVQNFRRYYTNADYLQQVRRLEEFVSDNPEATYARSLLGYHYGFLGYSSEARRELTKAKQLASSDRLTNSLLTVFGDVVPAEVGPQPIPEPEPSAAEVSMLPTEITTTGTDAETIE